MTQHLAREVASGAAWTAVSIVGRQVMTVAALAVLARYVPPSAYGLMGMATTVSNFLLLFRDLGTASALVQRRAIDESLLASVFWLNVTLGLLLTGVTALLAYPASWYFREPELVPVMQVVGLTFFASALSMVHNALLSREMQFRRMAVAELGGMVIGQGVAVSLAVTGHGVWSLVIGNLVNMTTMSALLWVVRPWRPRNWGSFESIKAIASYSLNLLGFTIVNYFSRNVDSLVVGRFLGKAALGYYQMAYSVMMYPIQNVTQVLGRVLLPTFSRIQDDNVRFAKAYQRVTTAIALITFPMMLGVMAVAEPFVLTLVGEQWRPIAPLLLILCPIGAVQSVQSSVGAIYTAKARTDWMFKWALGAVAVTIPGFLLGVPWGIYGVAIGYAIVTAILIYPGFGIPFKLIGLRFSDFAAGFRTILLCAVLMGGGVWLAEMGMRRWGIQRPLVLLTVGVTLGILLYVALLWLIRPMVLRHLVDLLRDTGRENVAGILEKLAPGPAPEAQPDAILKSAP
ncbi:MAG: MOP flippase family protein [Bryobacterales bacterium]|nr:MOP flippase family protein [Bryobacterales bacterium]